MVVGIEGQTRVRPRLTLVVADRVPDCRRRVAVRTEHQKKEVHSPVFHVEKRVGNEPEVTVVSHIVGTESRPGQGRCL